MLKNVSIPCFEIAVKAKVRYNNPIGSQKGANIHMITIKTDHFDPGQICDSGQCFRMKELQDGIYEVISRDRYLRLWQQGGQTIFDCSQEEFDSYWQAYFDLQNDYGSYLEKINPRDTYLTQAADTAKGVRILKQDLWEMIVTFLISQQNNIKRIHRCIDMICETYGKKCMAADGTVYYAFPEPEALASLADDALMACNLGYRSKYVVRTARAVQSGEIDLKKIKEMTYPKAKEELLKCYGVGEKVADCICLFALHDLDAFPVDTHIRQVLDAHYRRGFPNRRYKGFRGVLQQYIFYYELHKNKMVV